METHTAGTGSDPEILLAAYRTGSVHVLTVSLEGIHKPHILNINLSAKPAKVELDGAILLDTVNYTFDEKRSKLIIRTGNYTSGKYKITK